MGSNSCSPRIILNTNLKLQTCVSHEQKQLQTPNKVQLEASLLTAFFVPCDNPKIKVLLQVGPFCQILSYIYMPSAVKRWSAQDHTIQFPDNLAGLTRETIIYQVWELLWRRKEGRAGTSSTVHAAPMSTHSEQVWPGVCYNSYYL